MSRFTSTPHMRVIAAAYRANVPLLVWGSPGQAKSAKIGSYAKKWCEFFDTIVGGNREATDFLGLPIQTDDGVINVPPSFAIKANAAKSALLFFDELTTAAPSVQKAMLRIFQERVVGELQLKDHVRIIAAANPPEQAADGWDLPAPVANRLLHLDWHFDVDEFLVGVMNDFATSTTYSIEQLLGPASTQQRAHTASMITAFLRERGSDLLTPEVPQDPTKAGRAWPSPRSWSNAIAVLSEINPRDESAQVLALSGLVGEGAATEYFKWAADLSLPNPDDVLRDPEKAIDWSQRPDVLFAIARSVSYTVVNRGKKEGYEAAFKVMDAYTNHNRTDVALPSVKELLSTMPDGTTMPAGLRTKFATTLEGAGIAA